jgi:hypothetical protein
MCKKTKGLHNRIDPCIKYFINFIRYLGLKPVASCCGHGKYPKTVIIETKGFEGNVYYELLSGKFIPRKRNFYTKDKQGYYFIKETLNQDIKKEVKRHTRGVRIKR